MSTVDEVPNTGRAGSAADLSFRVERLERDLSSLTGTVSLIERNQQHAEQLNKLRFDSLDKVVDALHGDLKAWMTRMEGVFTGEVQTAAARDLKTAKDTAEREGATVMADWTRWRAEVDDDREHAVVMAGQLSLLGKMVIVVFGSSALALLAGLYALAQHPPAGIGS